MLSESVNRHICCHTQSTGTGSEPIEETEAVEKIEEADVDDKEIRATKKPRTEKRMEAFNKYIKD